MSVPSVYWIFSPTTPEGSSFPFTCQSYTQNLSSEGENTQKLQFIQNLLYCSGLQVTRSQQHNNKHKTEEKGAKLMNVTS